MRHFAIRDYDYPAKRGGSVPAEHSFL